MTPTSHARPVPVAGKRGTGAGSLDLSAVAPEVEIRALATRDSLAALTDLLHRAYAPLAARGMNLHAATQSEEQTRQRTLSGQTFVAAHGRKIVGTVTVSSGHDVIPGSLPDMVPQFKAPGSARFHQFAVDPEWRGRGLAPRLVEQAEEWARSHGYHVMALDMAESAEQLCAFYGRMGYRVVDHVQWPGKTYRSVVMTKALEYSPLRAQLLMLARYNLWATGRLLDQVATLDDKDYRRPLGLPFGSIHGTLNHLLVGEHLVWWRRIALDESPQIDLAAEVETDRQQLALRLREGAAHWIELIDRLSNDRLLGPFQYRNLKGDLISVPMAQVLAHVVNHGTHHRGQITAAWTRLGHPAMQLDLIFMLQQEGRFT